MLFIFLSPPSNESPRQNCDCWKVSGKFLVSQQDERSFKTPSLLAAPVDCHPCVSSHYERWEIQFVDGAQVRGSFWRSIYQALPCWLRFSGAQDKKNFKVNFLPLIICHSSLLFSSKYWFYPPINILVLGLILFYKQPQFFFDVCITEGK